MLALDVAASVDAARYRQTADGTRKTSEDLDRYAQVLDRTRPDLIVETGTQTGGSALWFARRGVDVVTVDINLDQVAPEARAQQRIMWLLGSSTARAVVDAVHQIAAQYRRVMVVLDSDHRAPHVRRELLAYSDLVSPGCYLVVEDGICRWLPGWLSSPLDAIEDLLVDDHRFIEDTTIEEMHPVTMFPRGWWWRRA